MTNAQQARKRELAPDQSHSLQTRVPEWGTRRINEVQFTGKENYRVVSLCAFYFAPLVEQY